MSEAEKVSLPTRERIEEIKQLIAAATPGPWEVVNLGQIEIATNYRVENGMHVANWIAEMDVQEEDQEEQAGVDAELIVAAVNSLPGLLAALEEAQYRIGDLETGLRVSERTGMKWYDELAEAQQTIARHKEDLGIAMTQNQNPEVFRRIQRILGETQP